MARDDLPDDLDELLDDRRADLEARFQELERDAEIERMRQESGAPRSSAAPAGDPPPDAAPGARGGKGPQDPPRAGAAATKDTDPLSDMKDVLDGEKELELYLLVVCPECDAKNRMSLTRVRTAKPICGRCKKDLSFTKF